MFKKLSCLLLVLIATSILPLTSHSKEVVVSKIERIDLLGQEFIKVEANSTMGFNFPFYLFIPETVDKDRENYLYVEPNNTGTIGDDLDQHLKSASMLVKMSYANRIARKLNTPLLTPVFPRPETDWRCYTHALDRDSLEIEEGSLKRIDHQLKAMVDFALKLLQVNDIKMHDKIMMHGFSASAKFCNRFAFLHPRLVKAVATGGVNGFPTIPLKEHNGCTLPFPIGIADIEKITGDPYEEAAHKRVAQFVYMGSFDRNDTVPSRDAWSEEEATIILKATAPVMMPDRWAISQKVYQEKFPRAQCVTYNGIGHAISDEMLEDVVKFFKSNYSEEFVAIEPHAYPFKEYRKHKVVHVDGVYFKGDDRLPEYVLKNCSKNDIIISIKDWWQGQDHRQLSEFYENAGFNFILRAEGQRNIVINRSNYGGSCNLSNGQFQVFRINLTEDQLKTLACGIPYTLQPENKTKKYQWIVEDDVKLVRPAPYTELVVAALDQYKFPNFECDANIKYIVDLLNKSSLIQINCTGSVRRITFKLVGDPDEIAKAPNICFSAKGLSATELLMIICHRSSLIYRIEANTIYIEKKY